MDTFREVETVDPGDQITHLGCGSVDHDLEAAARTILCRISHRTVHSCRTDDKRATRSGCAGNGQLARWIDRVSCRDCIGHNRSLPSGRVGGDWTGRQLQGKWELILYNHLETLTDRAGVSSLSVAIQVTVVMPMAKVEPEVGAQATLGPGLSPLSSVAVGPCMLTNLEAIPRTWPGFVGRIDQRMIQQAVPDYQDRTFYLSGSLDMMRAYEHLLRNMHVRPEQIKKDLFPGLV